MGLSGGCRHSFSWTTSSTNQLAPPEGYLTWCPGCGTWGRWESGGWKAQAPSLGALAMEQAERFGVALQQILAVAGEKDEVVRIIREVHGV